MSVVDKILEIAESMVGKADYVWGGTDMSTGKLDCSGFTQGTYAMAGVTIGRDTNAQWSSGTYIEKDELKPGDLVFFHSTYDSNHLDNVSHVGIYKGGDTFIHCSSSKDNVVYGNLSDSYWTSHYLGAKRYVEYDGTESKDSSGGIFGSGESIIETGIKEKVMQLLKPITVVVVAGGLVVTGSLLLVGMVKNMK